MEHLKPILSPSGSSSTSIPNNESAQSSITDSYNDYPQSPSPPPPNLFTQSMPDLSHPSPSSTPSTPELQPTTYSSNPQPPNENNPPPRPTSLLRTASEPGPLNMLAAPGYYMPGGFIQPDDLPIWDRKTSYGSSMVVEESQSVKARREGGLNSHPVDLGEFLSVGRGRARDRDRDCGDGNGGGEEEREGRKMGQGGKNGQNGNGSGSWKRSSRMDRWCDVM